MSNAAVTWAFAQDLPSSDKFVLVAVADWAADREVYASIPAIGRKTGLNEKTVRVALQRLVASGHLHPTGERRGKTKQIVVYEITFSEDLFAAALAQPKAPKNGSLPKTGASQKREGEGSQNWEGEGSQNWEADTNRDTKKENNNNYRAREPDPVGAVGNVALPTEEEADIDALTRQCQLLAGIHDVARAGGKPSGRWRKSRTRVAAWIAAGADSDLILDAIENGRASATDGVNSLDYFDLAVRKRLAQATATTPERTRRRPNGMPVAVAEDASDEARALKLRLREVMERRGQSPATWAAWIAPCRFAIEGDDLAIRAPSAYAADWVRNNLTSVIGGVAGDRTVRVAA